MKKIIGIIILIILVLIITISLINYNLKDRNGVIYITGYLENIPKDKENVIIDSYEELSEYFDEEYMEHVGESVGEIIKKYNSEFFENNNLAIIYKRTGDFDTTMYEYIKRNVKGTNAEIIYKIISPSGNTPDIFMPGGIFIVVKIPKEVTSISEKIIYKYK